jgi:hypothetical protein
MDKMFCTCCADLVEEDDVRYAYEEPYCEDCFSDKFSYCERCDTVVNNTDAYFDSEGTPYCWDCWNENYDDQAPDNPSIDDADRELIVELSRGWLLGKTMKRGVIKINQNDFLLTRIKQKIGVVDNPIYIFGLKDRDEYQISASTNLMDAVKEFIQEQNLDWKVTQGIGCNRLGIALSLRKNHSGGVLKLIKEITRQRVPA